jgi:hypothetical protein
VEKAVRPNINFIPLSTDVNKIELFGTLMPALMLLKVSLPRFVQFQITSRITPKINVKAFIATGVDDAA